MLQRVGKITEQGIVGKTNAIVVVQDGDDESFASLDFALPEGGLSWWIYTYGPARALAWQKASFSDVETEIGRRGQEDVLAELHELQEKWREILGSIDKLTVAEADRSPPEHRHEALVALVDEGRIGGPAENARVVVLGH